MKVNKKYFYIIFLLFTFLLFFKTDFRFETSVNCCGDDHDYYMHSETIALDRDLNYSNQLKGNEDKSYKFIENEKIKREEILIIINLVATVIQNGMKILGVSLPNKM